MMASATPDTAAEAADELADVCADLLAEARHERFLITLFAGHAGEWRPLADLLRDLGEVRSKVVALEQVLASPTQVAWLAYPACTEGPGYATVMFFNEAGMNRIWVYHQHRLGDTGPH